MADPTALSSMPPTQTGIPDLKHISCIFTELYKPPTLPGLIFTYLHAPISIACSIRLTLFILSSRQTGVFIISDNFEWSSKSSYPRGCSINSRLNSSNFSNRSTSRNEYPELQSICILIFGNAFLTVSNISTSQPLDTLSLTLENPSSTAFCMLPKSIS